MLDRKNLYIHKEVQPITTGPSGSTTIIGTSINKYEVRKYIDVQNLEVTNCYIVTCTQRIIIANQTTYSLSPIL